MVFYAQDHPAKCVSELNSGSLSLKKCFFFKCSISVVSIAVLILNSMTCNKMLWQNGC